MHFGLRILLVVIIIVRTAINTSLSATVFEIVATLLSVTIMNAVIAKTRIVINVITRLALILLLSLSSMLI